MNVQVDSGKGVNLTVTGKNFGAPDDPVTGYPLSTAIRVQGLRPSRALILAGQKLESRGLGSGHRVCLTPTPYPRSSSIR